MSLEQSTSNCLVKLIIINHFTWKSWSNLGGLFAYLKGLPSFMIASLIKIINVWSSFLTDLLFTTWWKLLIQLCLLLQILLLLLKLIIRAYHSMGLLLLNLLLVHDILNGFVYFNRIWNLGYSNLGIASRSGHHWLRRYLIETFHHTFINGHLLIL